MVSIFASTCVQHFLNQMSGAFELVVQHCWKCKNRWKLVESNLNWFKLSFNIHTTFPLLSIMLNGVESRLNTPCNICPTFAQHPFNFCRTNVDQMLKLFKQALSGNWLIHQSCLGWGGGGGGRVHNLPRPNPRNSEVLDFLVGKS